MLLFSLSEWLRAWSKLILVMACYLMASSHYLNQRSTYWGAMAFFVFHSRANSQGMPKIMVMYVHESSRIQYCFRTIECHYNTVQYHTTLHTSLQWLGMNIIDKLTTQKTPHNSPEQASYGVVSYVMTLDKTHRVITAPHCISCLSRYHHTPPCFDQLAGNTCNIYPPVATFTNMV